MPTRIKITYPTAMVLQALAQGHHYGFDILDATGLPSGTVYPILRRLDRLKLVLSSWEEATIAQREQRPPRRYYELEAAGRAELERALLRFPPVATAVLPVDGLEPDTR